MNFFYTTEIYFALLCTFVSIRALTLHAPTGTCTNSALAFHLEEWLHLSAAIALAISVFPLSTLFLSAAKVEKVIKKPIVVIAALSLEACRVLCLWVGLMLVYNMDSECRALAPQLWTYANLLLLLNVGAFFFGPVRFLLKVKRNKD